MSEILFNCVTASSHYSILETDLNEITKNIYLGDKRTAKNIQLLKRLGIKKALVAGHELSINYPNDFNFLHLSIKDTLKEGISLHFDMVYDFIQKSVINGEGVFNYCAFGVSRSPTLIIAYLMKKLKISFRQAFAFVRRKRTEINPNANFENQLINWQCVLKKRVDFNKFY